MLMCRTCKEEVLKYANGKKCRRCYNEYMANYILKRYHKRRAAAIEQLGGKCVECSVTENLEFDHIDPNTKTGDTGKLFTMGEQRLQDELGKCQLLCNECHKGKTFANKIDHGGGKAGIRNCKCVLCRAQKNSYMRDWKRRQNRSLQ